VHFEFPNQTVNRNHKGNQEPEFRRRRLMSKLRSGKFSTKDLANEFGYSTDHVRLLARKVGVKPLVDPAGYGALFDSLSDKSVTLFKGVGSADALKKAANYRGIRIRTWKDGNEIWIARY